MALDGKTLRGTQKHLVDDQRRMHQVNLYETQTGIVLKEQIVAEKESEQSRVNEWLIPLYLKGRVLTADALHTNASVCASIVASGGDYLLFAKGNQPILSTQEWVYGFTSLSPKQASPLRLLALVRDHWAIENRLHWRRDVI